MEPTKKTDWLPWAVVAVLAFMLFRGTPPTPPGPDDPKPPPGASAAELAADVITGTAAGYASAFEAAAAKVDAGEISTDRELVDNLSAACLAARQAAKVEFDRAFENEMPNGAFGDASADVADLLRAIGKGFR